MREFDDGWVPFIPAGDANLSRRARVRAVFADLYWSRGHSLRWLAAPVVGFALINLGLLVYAADKDRVGQQAYEATGTEPDTARLPRAGAALESLGRPPTEEPPVSSSELASGNAGSLVPVDPTTDTDPAGPLLAAPTAGIPTTATPTTATPTTEAPSALAPVTEAPTTSAPTTLTPTTLPPATEAPTTLTPTTTRRGGSDDAPGHNKKTRKGGD